MLSYLRIFMCGLLWACLIDCFRLRRLLNRAGHFLRGSLHLLGNGMAGGGRPAELAL